MFVPNIALPPFPCSVCSLSGLSRIICSEALRAHVLYTECMPNNTSICPLPPSLPCLKRLLEDSFLYSAVYNIISTSLSLSEAFTLRSSQINTTNLHKVDLSLNSALSPDISEFLLFLKTFQIVKNYVLVVQPRASSLFAWL